MIDSSPPPIFSERYVFDWRLSPQFSPQKFSYGCGDQTFLLLWWEELTQWDLCSEGREESGCPHPFSNPNRATSVPVGCLTPFWGNTAKNRFWVTHHVSRLPRQLTMCGCVSMCLCMHACLDLHRYVSIHTNFNYQPSIILVLFFSPVVLFCLPSVQWIDSGLFILCPILLFLQTFSWASCHWENFLFSSGNSILNQHEIYILQLSKPGPKYIIWTAYFTYLTQLFLANYC